MEKSVRDYILLVKPGIVMGNLLTMVAGFAFASRGYWNLPLLAWSVLGLSCVIMSACAWNNYIDRELDRKMRRTQKRPLVTGAISLSQAQQIAVTLSLIGFFALLYGTNVVTTLVAFFGFILYVFGYSFAKYRFSEATLVGAFAGATPTMIGYTAVTGTVDFKTFLLFLVLVFWQMPHFFAIAIYRLRDYSGASIPLLPVQDGIPFTKVAIFCYLLGFVGTSFIIAPYTLPVSMVWLGLGISGFFTTKDTIWAYRMFLFSLVVITVLSLSLIVSSFI
jgi:protoheme IX farnesyltransferase